MSHPLSNNNTDGQARCNTGFNRAVTTGEVLPGVLYLEKQQGRYPAAVPRRFYGTDTLASDFVAANYLAGSVHKAGDLFLRTPRGEDRNGKRQPGSLPQNKAHLDPPLGVLRLV